MATDAIPTRTFWVQVKKDTAVRRLGIALLIYFVGLAIANWRFDGYRFDDFLWLHVVAAAIFAIAVLRTLLPDVNGAPFASLSILAASVVFILFVVVPFLRGIDLDNTPLFGNLFGNEGLTEVELNKDFLADRPECDPIKPGTYAARDSDVMFEFAATPPLPENPEDMLSMLFTDIFCEDEVNMAGHMTGMRESVQLEGQSNAAQGNALANLLGSKGDGEHIVWRNTLDVLWERWTTSKLESIGDFGDMVEDGDANLLCQNADVDGRPRLVQLDDVVLDDLKAQVGNDLHAFIVNRGDAPGFEDGHVAFLTDVGCFAFDEESFGESVDNVEQAQHGLNGEEEIPATSVPSPDNSVPSSDDTEGTLAPPSTEGENDTGNGGDTGDETGEGDKEGTTGEPGTGGECEGTPTCSGENDGDGGSGGDDCVKGCDGDGGGDKCEVDCNDGSTSTTCPSCGTTTTTHGTTTTTHGTTTTTHGTTTTTHGTTTTTQPTTTTTQPTTTTTRPTTTTSLVTTTTMATTTTTKPSTTTSTTEPPTTTTSTPKGTAPCSPFDPECSNSDDSPSGEPPSTLLFGLVEIPASPDDVMDLAMIFGSIAGLVAITLIARKSEESLALGRKE